MARSLLLAVNNGVQDLSIFHPVSPSGESILNLTNLLFFITGVIFIIVEIVLIYSIIRFRRQKKSDAAEPPQVYGSMPIEVAWTVGPALIVLILSLILSRTVVEVQADPARPPQGAQPLHVTVIGHRWWWEYVYDEYDGKKLGFATANELHVPQSAPEVPRPVYLTLKSADVCHSFWVPRLGGKTDLIPNRSNRTWFQTQGLGLFQGQCAEYCGTQHANMLLRVVVESPEDFRRWLDNESKPAVDDPAVKKGRETFLSQSCVNCHTIRGTSARGTVGPDLTHLMSRQTLLTGMVPNDREHLRRWIGDPQQVKQGCSMPAFRLQAQENEAIVDYLLTLR